MASAAHPALSVAKVSRRFGAVQALDAVDFDIAPGEIVSLVGQSGCGKSTILRVVAGIEEIDSGTVSLDGRVVTGSDVFVEPEDRNVGFVFQDYALFPHLTARRNIGFGLSRLPRSEREQRVQGIIDRLDLGALADRYPHMLSGGEQQRIALARALAPQPHILLMDEPFSNLDRRLRDTIRHETMDLLRSLGTTAIVVTHDPEEALSLGDRVVLMQAGRVIENGRGDRIYDYPATPYSAEFFSRFNRIPTRRSGDSLVSPLGTFALPAGRDASRTVLLYIRPQAITLAETGIPARVASRMRMGEIEELRLDIEGLDTPLMMRTSVRSMVNRGDVVHIQIDPDRLLTFMSEDNAA